MFERESDFAQPVSRGKTGGGITGFRPDVVPRDLEKAIGSRWFVHPVLRVKPGGGFQRVWQR